MQRAFVGARVFDGQRIRENAAVITNGPRIEMIVPAAHATALPSIKLDGGLLAPGFIDVQVNGGGGALLNDNPSPAVVETIARSHRKYGVTGLLPTVITDRQEIIEGAIAAVRSAVAGNFPGVLGIHIEGPFLDPRRKGAHRADLIRTMTALDADWLMRANCGITMTTVAPSATTPELIRRLAAAGALVSIGHADCTAAEAQTAFQAGARAVTHLFNAMSQMGHREPGLAGAAMSDPRIFCGIIADGYHVDPVALKVAIAAKPRGKLMLISDAMPPAAGGPRSFMLQEREVSRVDGRLQLADGTLAGSNLTLDAAVRYSIAKLGTSLEEAMRMASLYPATFLKLEREIGRIAPGYRTNLVHLADDLSVRQTWIDGQT